MKHYTLKNSGVSISEQVFGCWAIGGTYFTGAEDAQSIAAIRSAIEHGINTLDTAPAYGHGHSENLVAEAIRGMNREDVVISTKLPRSLLARENVRPSCEKSLRDLSTDYIDIYFIHWPSDKGDPIADTMDELMKLKACGKIRCIGLSNFSTEQIIEAEKYGEVDVLQPCWSLLWRYQDNDSLAYAKEHGIGVINYSPLAQGILTGKFQKDRKIDVNDGRSHASLFQQPSIMPSMLWMPSVLMLKSMMLPSHSLRSVCACRIRPSRHPSSALRLRRRYWTMSKHVILRSLRKTTKPLTG